MLIENDKNTNQGYFLAGATNRGFYYSPEILAELRKRWAGTSDLYNLQAVTQEVIDFTNLVNALKASPETVYLLPIWNTFIYNPQGFIQLQTEGPTTAPSRLEWSKVVAYAFYWLMTQENYTYTILGNNYNLAQVCKLIVQTQLAIAQFNLQNPTYYNVDRCRDLNPIFWIMEVCQMIQLIIQMTQEFWTNQELSEAYNVIMKNNEVYGRRFVYACDTSVFGRSQFISTYEPQDFVVNPATAVTEAKMYTGSVDVTDYAKTINNRYTRGFGSCVKEEIFWGGNYYMDIAKATIKDFLAYGVYGDLIKSWTELHRSTKLLVDGGEPSVDGINYEFVTQLDVSEWSWYLWFFRSDKSMLNYSTTYGINGSQSVAPKTLLNQMEFEGEWLDGTILRYTNDYVGASTTYLISGKDYVSNQIRVNDVFPMALVNTYYNSGALFGIYSRNRKGVAYCDWKIVAKNLWFARGQIPANQSVYGYPSFLGLYNLESLFHT
jgi:hypothetical protein